MKVYVVSYGDMDCSNLLTIFSTRKLAEEYLAPYYKMVKTHGDECIEMFYPEISEVELDKIDADCKLQFYSVITKYDAAHLWGKDTTGLMSGEKGNRYGWSLRRVTYISIEDIIKSNEKYTGWRYHTTSVEEEQVKAEASKVFGEEIKWITFDNAAFDDDFELIFENEKN